MSFTASSADPIKSLCVYTSTLSYKVVLNIIDPPVQSGGSKVSEDDGKDNEENASVTLTNGSPGDVANEVSIGLFAHARTHTARYCGIGRLEAQVSVQVLMSIGTRYN